jgi:GxxExxY protein
MESTAARARHSANEVSRIVVDSALKVHSALGPGLLESVYQTCLAQELRTRGLLVEEQVAVPIVYAGTKLEAGYRIDLLVENCVIVEIKSVDAIAPVHRAQTLSYLRLSGKQIALLINFNVAHLKDGIKRFVMGTDWH